MWLHHHATPIIVLHLIIMMHLTVLHHSEPIITMLHLIMITNHDCTHHCIVPLCFTQMRAAIPHHPTATMPHHPGVVMHSCCYYMSIIPMMSHCCANVQQYWCTLCYTITIIMCTMQHYTSCYAILILCSLCRAVQYVLIVVTIVVPMMHHVPFLSHLPLLHHVPLLLWMCSG